MHRPVILNPLLARDDPAARDVSRLLYRRVLRLDSRASPIVDMAASWGTSGDGLEYRFTIVNGLRWSDGRPVTAADVVATVGVVQAAGFPDTRLSAAWKGVTATVADGALVFRLPSPRSSFAATLTDLPVVPATSVAGRSLADLLSSATKPLPTSGAYHVVSSDAATIRLERSPAAVAEPSLRSLEFHLVATPDDAISAFNAGQVDAVAATTPVQRAAASRVPHTHLYDMVSLRFVDLLLNARRPGLDDPVVRHAIASTIDRSAVVQSALGGAGRPQVDAIPAGVLWITDRSGEQPNPGLSARALDAAGWTPGLGGVRLRGGQLLSYTLYVPDAQPLPKVAAAIADQLRPVGISVTVLTSPAATFLQDVIATHIFDLAIADWDNGPDPDVSEYWRSNAAPPNGVNVSGLPADPFLDRALDSLATETDAALRQAAAAQVNQRLADDAPVVFLYAPTVSLAVDDAILNVALPGAGAPDERYLLIDRWRTR